MTNPMYSSQPNYSGVTIQIANPAVYAGGGGRDRVNSYGVSQPQICPNNNYYPQPQNAPAVYAQQEALPSYPPQYYLNNYNYQNNGTDARKNKEASPENGLAAAQTDSENAVKQYEPDIEEPQDFSKSKAVIDDLDARAAAEAEEKKNSKQKRVVALTDEYIKSLENYLYFTLPMALNYQRDFDKVR